MFWAAPPRSTRPGSSIGPPTITSKRAGHRPPGLAGGENATVLHYMHNDATLADGSLLLMDAGASLHGYCSDITRTWPLSGRFSAAQRDLYAAVLDVNQRVIAACQADGTTSLTCTAPCT